MGNKKTDNYNMALSAFVFSWLLLKLQNEERICYVKGVGKDDIN